MSQISNEHSRELTEHFFRNEYGKMCSVITNYLGLEKVQTAEDIVQETLYKALHHWTYNGLPANPTAWLYSTAKNLALNTIRRSGNLENIKLQIQQTNKYIEQKADLSFSDQSINDGQLKTMLACCQPDLSQDYQLALILKILCGFSIKEIASAFFSNTETISKRLVRGRQKLRQSKIDVENPSFLEENIDTILQAIYLLFNEGYKPSRQNKQIRFDLCLEAIRLCRLLIANNQIENKTNVYALLALMFLNASRFEARMNAGDMIVELSQQNRRLWSEPLRSEGLQYLDWAVKGKTISKYLIMATISANHCVANSFKATNWKEILGLYDTLLKLEDSAMVRLNRSVAIANVQGPPKAIEELEALRGNAGMNTNYLFHATLATFYREEKKQVEAKSHYTKAIELAYTELDKNFLRKKWTLLS